MMYPLSAQLRAGTQASHTLAENTAFMKCFLQGRVVKSAFRQLLANLYFVYRTLEVEMLRHRADAIAGPLYFPELLRTANLEDDLAYYYGENWRNQVVPAAAGEAYVARIREVSLKNPALLVAHAYVRYMGDLSGGQGLKKIARAAMQLPSDRGTGLHEFAQIPTVEAQRAFKAKYRDVLDQLPLEADLAQAIVDEANHAFWLNRNLLQSLTDQVRTAIGDRTFEQIMQQPQPGHTEPHPDPTSAVLVSAE
ncbi:biliverdin-producing heme oxygenase [Almyronema epifaneia]|uniref:heme oxygenase (biliverdin-producing) n=1 Tax=Almyronema epifaneia S1 TaxID=2991925 RepID=A0ABW6IB59_9CYAN